MKLKRNVPAGLGRGKYGVIRYERLAALDAATRTEVEVQLEVLRELGVLTNGEPNTADEFFVLMLKDVCSRAALLAYAADASSLLRDYEYADGVFELAGRAGKLSAFAKKPD